LTLYGYTENECCSETKCMEVRIEKVVKSAVQNEDQTLNNTVGSESSNKCWMKQNRPNPYIEKSTIDYFLPENIQSASLSIFTLEGVTLRSVEIKQRGFLKYELGQLAITPGIYFATLYADNEKVQTIRIVLVE
jgi:hypothetical protein